jgi:hypothetical protein
MTQNLLGIAFFDRDFSISRPVMGREVQYKNKTLDFQQVADYFAAEADLPTEDLIQILIVKNGNNAPPKVIKTLIGGIDFQ